LRIAVLLGLQALAQDPGHFYKKANVIHPEGEPYEDFVIRCMNFVKSHASDAGYAVPKLQSMLGEHCHWDEAECTELQSIFDGADLQHDLAPRSEAFCRATYAKVKAKREEPKKEAEPINVVPWTETETEAAKFERMRVFLFNRQIAEMWRTV